MYMIDVAKKIARLCTGSTNPDDELINYIQMELERMYERGRYDTLTRMKAELDKDDITAIESVMK